MTTPVRTAGPATEAPTPAAVRPAVDPLPDHATCYRAAAGRDPRWDGRLYLAVTSTGIYCRPSCPARTPRPENCRFYPTAAAAVAAGFRACRRCRPDALPGSRHWDGRGDLAARAVRLIREGAVDEVGVAGVARRLAVSERHLHRVLVAEVGAGPQQLARTRRAQTARMLLEQTTLPVAEVAFAAGFASVRQFNDVMRAEFALAPSALRGRRAPAEERAAAADRPSVVLRLRHRAPYAVEPLRRFLAGHAVPGLERHDPASGEHVRTVPAPHGPAVVSVLPGAAPDHVVARLRLADLADLAPVVARLRRWLDLDADPEQVADVLHRDARLAPLVAARPGLRVPGAVDGTETALLAVLGQQVSLGAARTFAGRLVAAFGTEAADDLHAFPDAACLAAAGPDVLRETVGLTTARARTLHAVAQAAADGLVLDPGADRDEARARLLALPGIGPWTTEYVALRALGDPDAYPAEDLVLRRALGVRTAREAVALAQAWRPWRGYALLHLWTERVFA
ncbi:MAG TPA: AlkA N-terminal domain-containing protein [Motilibacteraceae bacterium]|nr:AlkA N-terminal domain-containing protein [Motilibacteraceae bacterium]